MGLVGLLGAPPDRTGFLPRRASTRYDAFFNPAFLGLDLSLVALFLQKLIGASRLI